MERLIAGTVSQQLLVDQRQLRLTPQVHLYFSNSPFFDQTCNNAFLISQASATFTADGFDMIQNRVRFETELRKMAGIEYMVSEEPSIEKQSTNPIWVIKKQEREKVRRKRKEGSKEWEEEVTEVSQVLGTYYVIGSLIYEAPSVEKVLQSKLVSLIRPNSPNTAATD